VALAVEDFLADADAALSDGGDGGAFPGSMRRPLGETDRVGGNGEEVVEALIEIGGESEFVSAGIGDGFELDEVEVAPGWATGSKVQGSKVQSPFCDAGGGLGSMGVGG
jgi:hypothetical protein